MLDTVHTNELLYVLWDRGVRILSEDSRTQSSRWFAQYFTPFYFDKNVLVDGVLSGKFVLIAASVHDS